MAMITLSSLVAALSLPSKLSPTRFTSCSDRSKVTCSLKIEGQIRKDVVKATLVLTATRSSANCWSS